MPDLEDLARVIEERSQAMRVALSAVQAAIDVINGRLPEGCVLSLRIPHVNMWGGVTIDIVNQRLVTIDATDGGFPLVFGPSEGGTTKNWTPMVVGEGDDMVGAIVNIVMATDGVRSIVQSIMGQEFGVDVPVETNAETCPREAVIDRPPPQEPVFPESTKPPTQMSW